MPPPPAPVHPASAVAAAAAAATSADVRLLVIESFSRGVLGLLGSHAPLPAGHTWSVSVK
ncbi:hypothetical protein GCM10010492_57150 [Saccharothrix mutabilis subsp. mutabilis]|uniref:Uncharacterized protein n=1 Tax=Saccharothrix mutabilis subsp. mutabilis TaxID=66855 RepID=A0ABP3E473_9PSEU